MTKDNRIEIHTKNDPANPKYELSVDGSILDDVIVGGYYKEALGLPNYYVIAKEIDSLNKIADLKLKDFGRARVESIKLINWIRWEGFEISTSFNQNNESRKDTTFEVDFEPDLGNWKFPYSYNDYYRIFSQIWALNVRSTDYKKLKVGGIRDKFMPTAKAILKGLSIGEEVDENLKQFFEIHQEVLLLLKDEKFENTLLTQFSFPEEIKVFCKQYLEYFAAFLRGFGINSTSNLEEEAGKVLFSVTPTNNIEALDKIREALAVYLNLPASPIEYNESFAAMRLHQQIDNLQHSQRMAVREIQANENLLVAQSDVIREKNITIFQQQSVIEHKDRIIEKISSKSVMIDSLENKEKLYEGLEFVPSEALKKYLGIIFQPISFFKEIGGNLVRRDNEIINLNLNGEIDDKDI